MNWPYQFSPQILPAVFTVMFLAGLTAYTWRRRSVPGALPFAIGSLLGALWAAGSVMEYAAVDATSKVFWFRFQAVWRLPATTAITCFLLEYAAPGRWLTRRNIALLAIVPVLEQFFMITNDIHHLEWTSFTVEDAVIPQQGPTAWFVLVYGLGLGVVNLVILGWLFLRSPRLRWPVVIMITGQIAARTLVVLDVFRIIRYDLPLDILGLGFLFVMYAIVLFGFRIFDPIPLARQTVIEQLHAGMLVLDLDGRVTDLNPSALRILGLPASSIKGRPAQELFPSYSDLHPDDSGRGVMELNLGTGASIRDFTLEVSQLKDWRQLEVGRLLLLRDVTEPKRARELQKQQQLLLAVLQERERLARELHDDLGQVLGYIKMQAQAARDHLGQHQTEAADNDLARLAEVAQDAHTDVREYILGANAGSFTGPDFLPALRRYLQRFEENYGIRTELAAPAEVAAGAFEPAVEVQLLRMIQEALTNARKHGHASLAQVNICLLKWSLQHCQQ